MRGIAIGVGCRKGCPADAIEALVLQSLDKFYSSFPRRRESIVQQHGGEELDSRLRGNDGCKDGAALGLFTLIDKKGEAGLTEAADRLGLSLFYLSRDALRDREADVQTHSALAESLFGVPSVAEAAALAGAGPGSTLAVPRIAEGGVTCAIAEARP